MGEKIKVGLCGGMTCGWQNQEFAQPELLKLIAGDPILSAQVEVGWIICTLNCGTAPSVLFEMGDRMELGTLRQLQNQEDIEPVILYLHEAVENRELGKLPNVCFSDQIKFYPEDLKEAMQEIELFDWEKYEGDDGLY